MLDKGHSVLFPVVNFFEGLRLLLSGLQTNTVVQHLRRGHQISSKIEFGPKILLVVPTVRRVD